jgi:hypothetical protein
MLIFAWQGSPLTPVKKGGMKRVELADLLLSQSRLKIFMNPRNTFSIPGTFKGCTTSLDAEGAFGFYKPINKSVTYGSVERIRE